MGAARQRSFLLLILGILAFLVTAIVTIAPRRRCARTPP